MLDQKRESPPPSTTEPAEKKRKGEPPLPDPDHYPEQQTGTQHGSSELAESTVASDRSDTSALPQGQRQKPAKNDSRKGSKDISENQSTPNSKPPKQPPPDKDQEKQGSKDVPADNSEGKQKSGCCSCCQRKNAKKTQAPPPTDSDEIIVSSGPCCLFVRTNEKLHQSDPGTGSDAQEAKSKNSVILPCIVTWLVIIIIIIFAVVFGLICCKYLKVTLDSNHDIPWYLSMSFFGFCIIVAIVFLFLMKCRCNILRCCWLSTLCIFLVIAFGIAVYVVIAWADIPNRKDSFRACEAGNVAWMNYIIEDSYCCLMNNNGTTCGPNANKCTEYVDLNTSQFNSHVTPCEDFLKQIYAHCLSVAAILVLISMVLTYIPIVAYCLFMRKSSLSQKVAPQETDKVEEKKQATSDPDQNNNNRKAADSRAKEKSRNSEAVKGKRKNSGASKVKPKKSETKNGKKGSGNQQKNAKTNNKEGKNDPSDSKKNMPKNSLPKTSPESKNMDNSTPPPPPESSKSV